MSFIFFDLNENLAASISYQIIIISLLTTNKLTEYNLKSISRGFTA